MGKISPVVAKYIIHANIKIEGSVEKPDVIGAIFGQTEGLLGEGLELRELQKSGKIGRIDANLEIKEGKTNGEIIIPSSLDKTETAIIAAALETIQKIGPCDSKVSINNIEDVRVNKRDFILSRAKDLLKDFTSAGPDSAEITEEVSLAVKKMDIVEYGSERLPAGPDIDSSEEVIIVEGRADVINLLTYGFKNVIAINGTSVPKTITELSKTKKLIAFVDGDRGGDLIIKELNAVAKIEAVIKAPDGKEVEELTGKEIHKALRGKVSAEKFISEPEEGEKKPREDRRPAFRRESSGFRREGSGRRFERSDRGRRFGERPSFRREERFTLPKKDKEMFKEMFDDLVGTKSAYILDKNLSVLGKVPAAELVDTLKDLREVKAIIFDGIITDEVALAAEKARVSMLIATTNKCETRTRVKLFTGKDL